ncbi:hypothetical protein [Acinetobacter sp. P8-3-8]|uniref:hypothetical protein n=1 Tax=Acinetobacter sp. P8-3-8 TaxID=1029823 RepID=UPI0002485703|nr:hypothetical protein [Acinetobacter sp. P8-3-8]
MIFKDHIVRIENIKTMQMLNNAKLDHQVIAMFMTCEGVALQKEDVCAILQQYNSLGQHKVSHKKARALIQAKMNHFEDSELPCPTAY